jgi:hypothetical protein
LSELPPPFSVVRDTGKGTRRQPRQVGGSKSEPYQLFILENEAVIRVYDAAGNVSETHEHKGYFKDP